MPGTDAAIKCYPPDLEMNMMSYSISCVHWAFMKVRKSTHQVPAATPAAHGQPLFQTTPLYARAELLAFEPVRRVVNSWAGISFSAAISRVSIRSPRGILAGMTVQLLFLHTP
jgi:hypothetical protein